ncbi:MAG: bifunctional phosphopantothenoylcysteine decarboxylase/phosphopantothenate--cysteine ligase CoaBC [Candidatus Margulisbacteria bacterium]|jgi:phosphopantothenoylcysteine decarboxylase/phosphopantothenate--cysteine ligase|nr:bifunctional phosphopantothenoylcysteine decarboxylase/phosphopantothenate--cysteine ligase CoaBC [Candidatus Margulisiibacteriota bacterium]
MSGQKIIVGVTGGIACYKAVSLVSALRQQDFRVQVVMTENAARFVTPVTFRAVSRQPVCAAEFAAGGEPVPHIGLVEDAALYVVAPATANTIARLANGLADNILTASFLAARCPKIIVPAMNTAMWENPLTQENLRKLKKYGVAVIEPASGYLACGVSGAGRYPDNKIILAKIQETLGFSAKLRGKKIVITGGGTREPLDPVRVLANNSSGQMGLALKAAAEKAGADTVYIDAAALDVRGLKEKIAAEFANADALIMAAAVSDYRAAQVSPRKIKSSPEKLTIELVRTEDLLQYFAGQKKRQYLVGFALESENLLENAAQKLREKNLDLLAANDISALGGAEAAVVLLEKSGVQETLGKLPKIKIAEKIIEKVSAALAAAHD